MKPKSPTRVINKMQPRSVNVCNCTKKGVDPISSELRRLFRLIINKIQNSTNGYSILTYI